MCSAEEEDVDHFVLRCTSLSCRHGEGTDLSTALVITDSARTATTDTASVTSTTKERLRKWWIKTRR
ncbi:hypothetical protein MTO96_029991 [Rhipicephalus appendiculatus]